MPRLPTSLLKRAKAIDSCLVSLLPTCRDLPSARNELRWLKEHVESKAVTNGIACNSATVRHELRRLSKERGRGKPLQYILGNEYFGELELMVRPGVLIPRPETADAITHLVNRFQFRKGIRASEQHLRILDLCTGSGCMSLLLHHSIRKTFRKVSTSTLGIDISPKALALARANRKHVGITSDIQFKRTDVLSNDPNDPVSINNVLNGSTFDIIVANPPYISTSAFYRETARSVRNYEPRLALVPPHEHSASKPTTAPDDHSHPGDTFYPHLATIASSTNAKVILMEVGNMTQAKRIAAYFASLTTLTPTGQTVPAWHAIEIWCDGILAEGAQTRRIHRSGLFHIPIVGPKEITHGRTVVCWRNEAMYWLHTDCYIDGYWHQDTKAYVPWAFPVGSVFRTFSLGSGDRPAEWFNHVKGVSEMVGSTDVESTEEEVHASPHYSQKSLVETKP